jgi:predicted phosphate transport protein (TIGR00153 family)
MTNFIDIFGTPPFEPLNKHIQKANQCAEQLKIFFQHALNQDWERAEAIHQLINQLENEADLLKEKIRLHLPRTLFMSIERSDILDILSLQDRIANKAKDISGLICSRKMIFPEPIAQQFESLLHRSIDASNHLLSINYAIKKLISSNFRTHEADRIEEMIHHLDVIEDDTDHLEIILRDSLFKLESQWPPIEIIFLYKMIDWFGELADRSQKCGHRILLLIAR